jgi:hypothetical protein
MLIVSADQHQDGLNLERDAQQEDFVDAHQRGADLADRREPQCQVDHVERNAKEHEGEAEQFALIAFDEPVGQREVTHPPVPDRDEPVERRAEQPQQHAPDTAQTAGERRPPDRHRVVRARPRAKGGEDLEYLAKGPAAQKEVFLLLDRQHRQQSDNGHHHEIDG